MRSNSGPADGVYALPAGFAPPAVLRRAAGAGATEDEEDQDTGDLPSGVDEDALDYDDLDTDRVTSTEGQAASAVLFGRGSSVVVGTGAPERCA